MEKNNTILIVDDLKENLILLDLMIHQLDPSLTTIKASTGEEAVNIYKERDDIDCIIMDYNMPGIDGRTALCSMCSINKKKFKNKTLSIFTAANNIEGQKPSCDCPIMILEKPLTREKLKIMLGET
jgi:CheY-like chemotaxis protein